MQLIKSKLPHWDEIYITFGFLVFAVFSWSVRGFFYKLSSFLLYYSFGDIFGVFSYMMGIALLESVVVLLILLLFAFVLPKKWFSDGFAYKGSLLVLVVGIAMIFLQSTLTFKLPSIRLMAALGGSSLAFWLALSFLAVKVQRFKTTLYFILKRVSIFLYLYLPLGFIGLLVVVIRNIF